MPPAISSICGVATRACFAMCLHLGSSRKELQLSTALIFAVHYLGRITALVTILAICFLNLALWIAALVACFTNSAPSLEWVP